jgi:hypothetical protein
MLRHRRVPFRRRTHLQQPPKQRQKLQHGIDRLIDTFAEGVIDKDQFTPRMSRAKARLAALDAKIALRASNTSAC